MTEDKQTYQIQSEVGQIKQAVVNPGQVQAFIAQKKAQRDRLIEEANIKQQEAKAIEEELKAMGIDISGRMGQNPVRKTTRKEQGGENFLSKEVDMIDPRTGESFF